MAYNSKEKNNAGFREIEADIRSGAVNSSAPILLFGDETFLVNHYMHLLMKVFSGYDDNSIPEESFGLDISLLRGEEDSDDSIISALDTFPMMAMHRVIVVKNHAGLSSEGKTSLPDIVGQVPDTSRLIFTANNINKTRALYKAIAKHGRIYEFTKLSDFDLKAFVQKRFRAMNVVISPENLERFCQATGYLEKDSMGDLFGVENETNKISSFILGDGRTEILESDIFECIPDVLRTDVFAMLDAISSGHKGKAIELLENSLASGESIFRLLSLIIGHFEIMSGYKEMKSRDYNLPYITSVLGERHEWRVKNLGRFSDRFSEETLRKTLDNLYETEKNIRSGNIPERLAITLIFSGI